MILISTVVSPPGTVTGVHPLPVPSTRWTSHATARLLALLLFFETMSPGLAAETESAQIASLESEYLVETWQTDQGLPDNQVNAIAQTPDGYLWVATFNGLARFNGVNFVVFDSANTIELPSSRITNLDLDRMGRLWIRSELGHLSQWADGLFRLFTERDGLSKKGVGDLRQDHQGEIWVNSRGPATNALRFVHGRFVPATDTHSFSDRFGKALDADGFPWRVRSNRLVSVRSQGSIEALIPDYRENGSRLLLARDGGLWVIMDRIRKFHPPPASPSPWAPSESGAAGGSQAGTGRWEDYGPLPRFTDLFNEYLEDRLGNLWVGTGVGELWRIDTNRTARRFKLRGSAPRDLGKDILEDVEGNLWIGTWGGGLVRIKPLPFKTYDSRNGLQSDAVRSVAQDREGNIWFAMVSKVDWLPRDSERAVARGLDIVLPWCVYGSRGGAVYVGTFKLGLFRVDGEKAARFNAPGPGSTPPINVLFEDRNGAIYAGTPRGLFVLEADGLARCEVPGVQAMNVSGICEDGTGRLYVALDGEGLLCRGTNGWRVWTSADGLPGDNISAIGVDRQEMLWIAIRGKGLARFDGQRFLGLSGSQTPLPRLVGHIIEDDASHLWFSSNEGLYRASVAQLNDVATGRRAMAEFTHYDRADGMGSSQCAGSAWKARDGRIWFATMHGVTVVDPKTLPRNTRPPPVTIEQVFIDDQAVDFVRDARITVPPGAHRLEIRYTGLSFTAPSRVRFQYCLHPFDGNWVNAESRRSAYYTQVPPGEYRFQVIAANNDNLWNTTGASLAFIVQPHLWQMTWFRLVSALVLIGGAAALVRYVSVMRLQGRLAELERRHALENERGRISRDLHDNLGADLSQLALWSELAAQEKDRPEVMSERVRNVSALTREVIQNVEEIVWTVNPRNDSLDRFAAYVCEFSERVVTGAGLRFRWEAPEHLPPVPLPSDIRHHLFLVTKEALNNVAKHARASEARVCLSLDHGTFGLAISDNGNGFDATTASSNANGNGLANMRARIAECGGVLSIESRRGEGTTIRVAFPLSAGS